MSAQQRISKHPSSDGSAGHTLSAKHICAVFYSALESSQMLHKLPKHFCEIHVFGLLAAVRTFSPSVPRGKTPHAVGQEAPGSWGKTPRVRGEGGNHEYVEIENLEFYSELNQILHLAASLSQELRVMPARSPTLGVRENIHFCWGFGCE